MQNLIGGKYEKVELIGKGGFSKIYKVFNLSDNKYYVLKRIELKDKDKNEFERIKNEANFLSQFNSKYIVKYYDSFWEEKYFYIRMELCEGLDLYKFIESHKKENSNQLINKNIVFDFLLNICLGINEIHNKKIVHRDLKPKNLFLTKDLIIKIGDFGLSKLINDYAMSLAGTLYYMAPEIISRKPYKKRVDIWSLGCILYELCTLKIYSKTLDKSINVQYYGQDLQDLIYSLLNENYKERPKIRVVLSNVKNMINNYNMNIEKRQKDLQENEIINNFLSLFGNFFSFFKNLFNCSNNKNYFNEQNKSLRISASYDKKKEHNISNNNKFNNVQNEIKPIKKNEISPIIPNKIKNTIKKIEIQKEDIQNQLKEIQNLNDNEYINNNQNLNINNKKKIINITHIDPNKERNSYSNNINDTIFNNNIPDMFSRKIKTPKNSKITGIIKRHSISRLNHTEMNKNIKYFQNFDEKNEKFIFNGREEINKVNLFNNKSYCSKIKEIPKVIQDNKKKININYSIPPLQFKLYLNNDEIIDNKKEKILKTERYETTHKSIEKEFKFNDNIYSNKKIMNKLTINDNNTNIGNIPIINNNNYIYNDWDKKSFIKRKNIKSGNINNNLKYDNNNDECNINYKDVYNDIKDNEISYKYNTFRKKTIHGNKIVINKTVYLKTKYKKTIYDDNIKFKPPIYLTIVN